MKRVGLVDMSSITVASSLLISLTQPRRISAHQLKNSGEGERERESERDNKKKNRLAFGHYKLGRRIRKRMLAMMVTMLG